MPLPTLIHPIARFELVEKVAVRPYLRSQIGLTTSKSALSVLERKSKEAHRSLSTGSILLGS
jgi:hypothetical protein